MRPLCIRFYARLHRPRILLQACCPTVSEMENAAPRLLSFAYHLARSQER